MPTPTASPRSRGRRRWAAGSCRSPASPRARAGSGTGRRRRSPSWSPRPARSRRTRRCRHQQSTSLATSVPSRLAPIRTRTTAGWRLSVTNSSPRSSTALTGRPALRASAATSASRRTNVLAPNEPPIGGAMMRMSLLVDAEQAGEVGTGVERRLRPAPHGQAAVLPLGQGGVRLHRRVRRAGRAVDLLHDHVGLLRSRRRRRRGGSGSGDRRWCRRSAGRRSRPRPARSPPPRVQQRRAGRHGVERVEDRRQLLVRDLDQRRGRARRLASGRGDRGDHVAGVPGDVGEHALVLDLAAVRAEVRDVLRRQQDDVARQIGRVDREHARVRVLRAHEGGMQHAWPLDLDRVALRVRAGPRRGVAHGDAASHAPARDLRPRSRRRAVRGRPARVRQRLDPLRVPRGRPRPARRRTGPGSPAASPPRRRPPRAARRPRSPPRPPRTAGPRSSASGTCGTSPAPAAAARAPRPAARRARCRSRSSRGSARRRSRSGLRAASAARRARRAPRAWPAGPRRSRRRPARRRPSPGCARAGWPRAPNARASTGQPSGPRARRARCETIAPSRSSPSTTSIRSARPRGRATGTPPAPGSPGS